MKTASSLSRWRRNANDHCLEFERAGGVVRLRLWCARGTDWYMAIDIFYCQKWHRLEFSGPHFARQTAEAKRMASWYLTRKVWRAREEVEIAQLFATEMEA